MIPYDYDLCQKTVTLYRLENGVVRRRQLYGVFYEYHSKEVQDQYGRRQETVSLLVVPGNADIRQGDRIYNGIGPDIDQKQWRHFLPIMIQGLSEVNFVSPIYWEDQLCHIEAGRR